MRNAALVDTDTSSPNIKLATPLERAEMREIERTLHLRYNKWDTQVGDVNTLSEQPLVISHFEWDFLCNCAEQLAAEMMLMESALLALAEVDLRRIGVPKAIWKAAALDNPTRTARVLRFDFHPAMSGWCVSEVNSDVPGGWREGTSLPILFQPFYTDLDCPPSPLEAWGNAAQAVAEDGYVALLCAPGYLEDEQVVRTFMDELQSRRIPCFMIRNPAELKIRVSLVVRFYQAEWLCALPDRLPADIPTINPPISAVSESKRFPLAFRGSPHYPAWKALMPESRDPRDVEGNDWDDWVLKACYSNTGDKVLVCGNIVREQRQRAIREAQRHPMKWVAQRRFETRPLEFRGGLTHPCIGVFIVNGRAAGAYVRLSPGQVTDFSAVEAPLLIER